MSSDSNFTDVLQSSIQRIRDSTLHIDDTYTKLDRRIEWNNENAFLQRKQELPCIDKSSIPSTADRIKALRTELKNPFVWKRTTTKDTKFTVKEEPSATITQFKTKRFINLSAAADISLEQSWNIHEECKWDEEAAFETYAKRINPRAGTCNPKLQRPFSAPPRNQIYADIDKGGTAMLSQFHDTLSTNDKCNISLVSVRRSNYGALQKLSKSLDKYGKRQSLLLAAKQNDVNALYILLKLNEDPKLLEDILIVAAFCESIKAIQFILPKCKRVRTEAFDKAFITTVKKQNFFIFFLLLSRTSPGGRKRAKFLAESIEQGHSALFARLLGDNLYMRIYSQAHGYPVVLLSFTLLELQGYLPPFLNRKTFVDLSCREGDTLLYVFSFAKFSKIIGLESDTVMFERANIAIERLKKLRTRGSNCFHTRNRIFDTLPLVGDIIYLDIRTVTDALKYDTIQPEERLASMQLAALRKGVLIIIVSKSPIDSRPFLRRHMYQRVMYQNDQFAIQVFEKHDNLFE